MTKSPIISAIWYLFTLFFRVFLILGIILLFDKSKSIDYYFGVPFLTFCFVTIDGIIYFMRLRSKSWRRENFKSMEERLDKVKKLCDRWTEKKEGDTIIIEGSYNGLPFKATGSFDTSDIPYITSSVSTTRPRFNPILEVTIKHKKNIGGGKTLIFRTGYYHAVVKRLQFKQTDLKSLKSVKTGNKLLDKKIEVWADNVVQAKEFLTPLAIETITKKLLENLHLAVIKVTADRILYYEDKQDMASATDVPEKPDLGNVLSFMFRIAR
jgi:hypothetical protein